MAKRLTPRRIVKALTDAAKGRCMVGRVRVGRRVKLPSPTRVVRGRKRQEE